MCIDNHTANVDNVTQFFVLIMAVINNVVIFLLEKVAFKTLDD
jgi:Na+/alanine symporter